MVDNLPKDARKVYKKLTKENEKNKKKLLKLCKKYVETEDDNLLIDIEYYSDLMIDDIGDLLLIEMCGGENGN